MLFKVKHNGSQYCCAVSHLLLIVISVACSTRLEVFQCPDRKNIRKIEEKKKEKKQIWIDVKKIYRPPPLRGGGAYSAP